MNKTAQIQKLLNPKSIAVVGASRSIQKVGGVIFRNLLHSSKVRVYPVNPNSEIIQGQISYTSLTKLPEKVDLVVIAVPSNYVNEILEDCGVLGIKNVIVVSGGYKETSQQGLENEIELTEISKKYQINLLGPNCLGFVNILESVNCSFALVVESARKGGVSVVSQSGAVCTSFIDWAEIHGIGINKVVSIGNKSVLNENDFLEYFAEDNSTNTILLYLESFSDGRKFYEIAKSLTTLKPVVLLKPGQSVDSIKAISAHTGALSSNDMIIDRAMDDSGVIRVDSLEDLFNITKLLEWQPTLLDNKVAILTNAGGVGIDTVDQLVKCGLEVVEIDEKLKQTLRLNLRTNTSLSNPIDLLGDALANDYKIALQSLLKDKDINAIYVLLTPQFMTESLLTARYLNSLSDKNNKLVLASFIGGEKVHSAINFLDKEKLPHFDFSSDGARVLGEVWKWRKYIKNKRSSRLNYPTIINTSLKTDNPNETLDEITTKELLDKYSINYLRSYLFDGLSSIRKAEKRIKYPVVLKIKHPKLVHKTDVDAVRLPIHKSTELFRAALELEEIAKSLGLQGYELEIQPFIFQKQELILGINKDADTYYDLKGKKFLSSKGFGHVMLLGAGGIYTEVIKDTTIKLLPISKIDALEMIHQLKIGEIIFGARAQNFNYKSLLQMMVNLSKLIERNSNITSLDINPVFLTENEAIAADVKIFVS